MNFLSQCTVNVHWYNSALDQIIETPYEGTFTQCLTFVVENFDKIKSECDLECVKIIHNGTLVYNFKSEA